MVVRRGFLFKVDASVGGGAGVGGKHRSLNLAFNPLWKHQNLL